MRRGLLGVVLAFVASAAVAQPAITGVSGTPAQGATVTISGSNFGTKATAAPWKWDDANGVNGARLEPRGWNVEQKAVMPLLSNGKLRGTPGETTTIKMGHNQPDTAIFCFGTDPQNYLSFTSASAGNQRPFPTPARIDYWMNFQPPVGPTTNLKMFRHHAANGGSINGYWSFPGGKTSDWSNHGGSQGSGPEVADLDLPASRLTNRWTHVELDFSPTLGRFSLSLDGVQYMHSTNWAPPAPVANFCFETQMLESDGTGVMWFDDLYIDNTNARVVMGDAPTYAASRHREIQIPTAWSDGSVSVSLNRGTFPANASVWLYVVNASNVASAGRAITLGGTTPPPTAVDCVVSPFTLASSGPPLGACVGGSQTTTELWSRTITTQPANGGAACPVLTETRQGSQACTVTPPPTGCAYNGAVEPVGTERFERLDASFNTTTHVLTVNASRLATLKAAKWKLQPLTSTTTAQWFALTCTP